MLYTLGQKSNRVLSIFEHESNMKAVLSRIRQEPLFDAMTNHFLFKTLENVQTQDFMEVWLNIEGKAKSMF